MKPSPTAPTRPALTFGSLFAGIGGLDLGLERAGMTCRWQVEIDQKYRQVLAHHWPDVERMNDVKEISKPPAVDLICGGFPCQDLSVAGRRAGLDGERSGLWFEFLRIISEVKPQWVVIENVPGLLSSYSGDDPPDDLQPGREWETTEESDLAVIFRGLAKCGYWWAYRVLDAQYWGVPQRRRRVFIVASLGDWRGPIKVLFESKSSPWDSAPSREAGERIAGTFTMRSGKPGGGKGYLGFENRAMTLGGQPQWLANSLSAHHGRNCGEDTFIPVAFDTTQITSPDNHSNPQPGDACHTLNSNAHPPAMFGVHGVRRFTPLECERLQGFLDGWTAIDGTSDSARYKMLGNAVAVPVIQWISERIMEAHGETP